MMVMSKKNNHQIYDGDGYIYHMHDFFFIKGYIHMHDVVYITFFLGM